jgi:putative endonuclease
MSEKCAIAEQRGREGEAAMWLVQQGWCILAERLKTPRGEIDLIARKRDLVVFIKVKWRARAANLGDAIEERRLRRVAAAAEIVARLHAGPADDLTIDVILLAPGKKPIYIENAYQP